MPQHRVFSKHAGGRTGGRWFKEGTVDDEVASHNRAARDVVKTVGRGRPVPDVSARWVIDTAQERVHRQRVDANRKKARRRAKQSRRGNR